MRLLLLASLLLMGCSAKSKKITKIAYMVGNKSIKASSAKIEKDLTRGDSVFGTWGGEVFVYTEPLIRTQEEEKGKKK